MTQPFFPLASSMQDSVFVGGILYCRCLAVYIFFVNIYMYHVEFPALGWLVSCRLFYWSLHLKLTSICPVPYELILLEVPYLCTVWIAAVLIYCVLPRVDAKYPATYNCIKLHFVQFYYFLKPSSVFCTCRDTQIALVYYQSLNKCLYAYIFVTSCVNTLG